MIYVDKENIMAVGQMFKEGYKLVRYTLPHYNYPAYDKEYILKGWNCKDLCVNPYQNIYVYLVSYQYIYVIENWDGTDDESSLIKYLVRNNLPTPRKVQD